MYVFIFFVLGLINKN